MQFEVVDSFAQIPRVVQDVCYLIHSEWDDWYEFASEYVLHYYDHNGGHCFMGRVKIGASNMRGATAREYQNLKEAGEDVSGVRVTMLPTGRFTALPDNYFSMGTEDSYYEFLGKDEERRTVLAALRDMAYNLAILKERLKERIVEVSLLRGISLSRVEHRFAKLAHGEAALTDFEFQYVYPHYDGVDDVKIDWRVSVDSFPPSNVKVVIGRNGVGKTLLLRNVVKALCESQEGGAPPEYGNLKILDGGIYGVVFASLSTFEEFSFGRLKSGIQFDAVGCVEPHVMEKSTDVKKIDNISLAFAKALCRCQREPWRTRWLNAISLLKSDPIFNLLEGEKLLELPALEIMVAAEKFFKRLSSGHAAMMLLVTQLVRVLDEKFLVLIDEPECHLHPPLLASFIRCLSFLLRSRNAVCMITTHSPVVLQEVTSDSVWILSRHLNLVSAIRPRGETFGENTGVLMQEVFGLEMASSGYHKLLADIVGQSDASYDQILAKFKGRLGLEARAILRTMIAHRDAELKTEVGVNA